MCVESTTLASKTLCQVLEARLIETNPALPTELRAPLLLVFHWMAAISQVKSAMPMEQLQIMSFRASVTMPSSPNNSK